MIKYPEEGSSILVADQELSELKKKKRLWFLPHNSVWQAKKPDPRVVFDCAVKSCGMSLNDQLMSRPANTTSSLVLL